MKKKDLIFYTALLAFIITFAVTILGILEVTLIQERYLWALFVAYVVPLAKITYDLHKRLDWASDEQELPKSKEVWLQSDKLDLSITQEKSHLLITPVSGKANESKVKIVIGDITSTRNREIKCVALPVNSSFKDDCLQRKNSSTGAFIHSVAGNDLTEHIKTINNYFINARNVIGETILIPNFINSDFNVLFVAVTNRNQEGLISTSSINISYAAQELVTFARKNDIFEIYCPIFGSGDGGIPRYVAISSMIRGFFSAFEELKCNKISITIIAHKSNFSSLADIRTGLKEVLNL